MRNIDCYKKFYKQKKKRNSLLSDWIEPFQFTHSHKYGRLFFSDKQTNTNCQSHIIFGKENCLSIQNDKEKREGKMRKNIIKMMENITT